MLSYDELAIKLFSKNYLKILQAQVPCLTLRISSFELPLVSHWLAQ